MPAKFTPVLIDMLHACPPTRVLGVEVRVRPPLGAEQREALQRLGLAIGTQAGSVVTCRGPAAAVQALEGLDFVVSVDAGMVELS